MIALGRKEVSEAVLIAALSALLVKGIELAWDRLKKRLEKKDKQVG